MSSPSLLINPSRAPNSSVPVSVDFGTYRNISLPGVSCRNWNWRRRFEQFHERTGPCFHAPAISWSCPAPRNDLPPHLPAAPEAPPCDRTGQGSCASPTMGMTHESASSWQGRLDRLESPVGDQRCGHARRAGNCIGHPDRTQAARVIGGIFRRRPTLRPPRSTPAAQRSGRALDRARRRWFWNRPGVRAARAPSAAPARAGRRPARPTRA